MLFVPKNNILEVFIMKGFFKTLLGFAFAALLLILCVVGCYFLGYLIRWCIWLVGAIYELFFGRNAVTRWIANHDEAVRIICSVASFIVMVLNFIHGKSDNSTGKSYENDDESSDNDENEFSYEKERSDMIKRNFIYVDCSGNYRCWGEDFVDHKGNWCKWGSGFYDYDDNYIPWGGTYKDSSGSYRNFGDDFVDCRGNYIKLP